MLSDYQEILPGEEKLRHVIKLYYIHKSTDSQAVERITYFPNYATTLNIYRNSKVTWDFLSRTHEHDTQNKFLKLLVGKFDRSREIIMKGTYDKLTIVFHPLGLNHFLQIPLSQVVDDHFTFFDHFGEPFDELLDKVFSVEEMEGKRRLLDDFFLQRFCGFQEDRLTYAVSKILEEAPDTSIVNLADQLNISRKTLLRIFKTHLGYSPTAYKSIVKFRNALKTYQKETEKLNLSALAYDASYYDQSDLNFHFKAKTGLTPKQLFSKIQTITQELYWQLDYVPKVQDKQK